LARSGKSVRVLTNAFSTTDVPLVHAGYTRYRRQLLEAGVKIYELKLRGPMAPESRLQIKPLGLFGASLHAKTFAVDSQRVFIGSFNFDPRSTHLNCEMGLIIDSERLAARVAAAFDDTVAAVSYQPQLTADRKIVWIEQLPSGKQVTHQQEPGVSFFTQMLLTVMRWLPVEWAL
jgi:putative cardiolipin synthase